MRTNQSHRLWICCVLVLTLLIFWARILPNLDEQSLTVDEPVHLVRGLAYWRTGDLRLQYGHPPLSHALIGALPMLEPGLPSPTHLPGWADAQRLDVARQLVWGTPDRQLDRVVFLGRWPVLALGMLLAALSCRWATDLFGSQAGLIALFLCTFDPNLLAHASLATTDLPATCTIIAASYAFFRWTRRPTISRLVVAGFALGLAWAAKLSSLILIPVLGFAAVWCAIRERRRLGSLLAAFAGILVLGTLTLWAAHRFETGSLAGFWIPMPTHWDNVRRLWLHQSAGHSAYFLGQLSQRGWWYYFPILFVIKTPISTQLLLALGIPALRRAPKSSRPAVAFFFPILYFAATVVSNINIGYRHILPVVPFLVLIASASWRQGLSRSLALRVVSAGLMLWLAVSSLSTHPHYLTHFNEIVGGPAKGYQYAVDSNFDWGQDLKRLGTYVLENEIEDLRISYFGTDRPSRYLDSYEVLSGAPFEEGEPGFHPFNPDRGTYAISASHLQGLLLFDADTYDWFRRQQPAARVGSILLFHVEPTTSEATWAALGHAPAPPLSRDKLVAGLGRSDLRYAHFDCSSSWVYPAEGSGWYVASGLGDGCYLGQRFVREEKIVFQGRPTQSRPGLTVSFWETRDELSERLNHLDDQDKANNFGDLIAFLGSERAPEHNSNTLGLESILITFWEVRGRSDVPVSIMAHLTDESDNVVAVADGLGVPVENWMPGDVLVQMHRFEMPPGAPPGPYTPRIGLYVTETIEHISLADGSGDVLRLAPLDTQQGD